MLSVTIPCAGKGVRLGLPYPKELHVLDESGPLINNSMRLLEPYSTKIEHINIVLAPGKEDVFYYLDRTWGQQFKFVAHLFDDRYFEWPGSILSAHKGFTENNLVLLPDSKLIEVKGNEVVPSVLSGLSSGNDLVFGYLREQSKRLHSLGALFVNGNSIDELEDKPVSDIERFNAFWGCFGFRGEIGSDVLNFMAENVRKKIFGLSRVTNAVVGFELESYRDLGTWDSIRDYVSQRG